MPHLAAHDAGKQGPLHRALRLLLLLAHHIVCTTWLPLTCQTCPCSHQVLLVVVLLLLLTLQMQWVPIPNVLLQCWWAALPGQGLAAGSPCCRVCTMMW